MNFCHLTVPPPPPPQPTADNAYLSDLDWLSKVNGADIAAAVPGFYEPGVFVSFLATAALREFGVQYTSRWDERSLHINTSTVVLVMQKPSTHLSCNHHQ